MRGNGWIREPMSDMVLCIQRILSAGNAILDHNQEGRSRLRPKQQRLLRSDPPLPIAKNPARYDPVRQRSTIPCNLRTIERRTARVRSSLDHRRSGGGWLKGSSSPLRECASGKQSRNPENENNAVSQVHLKSLDERGGANADIVSNDKPKFIPLWR